MITFFFFSLLSLNRYRASNNYAFAFFFSQLSTQFRLIISNRIFEYSIKKKKKRIMSSRVECVNADAVVYEFYCHIENCVRLLWSDIVSKWAFIKWKQSNGKKIAHETPKACEHIDVWSGITRSIHTIGFCFFLPLQLHRLSKSISIHSSIHILLLFFWMSFFSLNINTFEHLQRNEQKKKKTQKIFELCCVVWWIRTAICWYTWWRRRRGKKSRTR